jgi:hypothetical protein
MDGKFRLEASRLTAGRAHAPLTITLIGADFVSVYPPWKPALAGLLVHTYHIDARRAFQQQVFEAQLHHANFLSPPFLLINQPLASTVL